VQHPHVLEVSAYFVAPNNGKTETQNKYGYPGGDEARCKFVEKSAEGADLVTGAAGLATGATALLGGPVAIVPGIFALGAGGASLFLHGVHYFTCP
jgi:hypothetical protein